MQVVESVRSESYIDLAIDLFSEACNKSEDDKFIECLYATLWPGNNIDWEEFYNKWFGDNK